MEKENLKLTNNISSLITDDLKKNTKHESLEHAKFYSRHHELVDSTQMTNDLRLFRSFALLPIRVLPDLMMDTHRCIAIGRNCLPFRIT
jgi:hypothetical protein